MSNMNNDVMMTAEAPKKNWGYRLFAVLLLAICAATALVLPFNAIVAGEASTYTLLDLITAVLGGSGEPVFGFIPSMGVAGAIGTIYTLAFYLLLVGVAAAALFALIAFFTAKNAPALVRVALFYLTAGALIYSLAFALTLNTLKANGWAIEGGMFDMISLALAVAGTVLYFLFSAKKVGKVAGAYFLQAILSVAFSALLAIAIGESAVLMAEDAEQLAKTVAMAAVAVMLINTLISIGRMAKKDGIVFDLVRYFIVLILALLVVAKTGAPLFGIVAAVIVVLQIIIAVIQLIKSKKAEADESREEAVQQLQNSFHMEEYAEAYPYEGGPVAGVLMAEEVNPSFLPHEPHVTTAGYDFYNCKSFDPFIATLDTAERNEFTELFILKFKGTMPELPDYEVGGDNKEFFRKIFIYLGQYRDRMSQNLLAKMYQFSMKI